MRLKSAVHLIQNGKEIGFFHNHITQYGMQSILGMFQMKYYGCYTSNPFYWAGSSSGGSDSSVAVLFGTNKTTKTVANMTALVAPTSQYTLLNRMDKLQDPVANKSANAFEWIYTCAIDGGTLGTAMGSNQIGELGLYMYTYLNTAWATQRAYTTNNTQKLFARLSAADDDGFDPNAIDVTKGLVIGWRFKLSYK